MIRLIRRANVLPPLASTAAVHAAGPWGADTTADTMSSSVTRALVLSNGALGAEGQSLGLVKALGLGHPGSETCDVRLVGEAALALAPRLGAAWAVRKKTF